MLNPDPTFVGRSECSRESATERGTCLGSTLLKRATVLQTLGQTDQVSLLCMSYSRTDFHRQFMTDAVCLRYLFDLRWENHTCPSCGRVGAYHRHGTKRCFTCNCGQHQIFPQKGTLLEGSPIAPRKWFFAMFLVWESSGRVTAKELERQLRLTYPTVWRMKKRVGVRADDAESFTAFLDAAIVGR